MSRIGIGLCFLYVIIFVIAFIIAYGADYKGEFVFLQAPIVLQLVLAGKMGLYPFFEKIKISWLGLYLILGLPMFALLYLVGWLLEKLFHPSLLGVYCILMVPTLGLLWLIFMTINSIYFSSSLLKTYLFLGGPTLILLLIMIWAIAKL